MKHTLLILAALMVAACGTDSNDDGAPVATNGKQTQQGTGPDGAPELISLAINTMADLPTCDASREQQLVYVMETKQFQTCHAGSWAVIDITGPAGAQGAAGAKGDTGAAGAAGKDAPTPAAPTAREMYIALLTINAGNEVGALSAAAQALLSGSSTTSGTVNNFCSTNAATRYLRTVTDSSGYFEMSVTVYQGKVYVISGTDQASTTKYNESIACPP